MFDNVLCSAKKNWQLVGTGIWVLSLSMECFEWNFISVSENENFLDSFGWRIGLFQHLKILKLHDTPNSECCNKMNRNQHG